MRMTKWEKVVTCTLICCLFIAVASLTFVRHMIVFGLDDAVARAQTAHPHPGDNIAALMDFVRSESHSLKDRNSAIWALGQLRNRRSLVMLEKLYTAGDCDHSRDLCQYELKKAIALCRNQTPDILLIAGHDTNISGDSKAQ